MVPESGDLRALGLQQIWWLCKAMSVVLLDVPHKERADSDYDGIQEWCTGRACDEIPFFICSFNRRGLNC